jgi:aspartokinase
MKFGGSSLADETRIEHVAQLIKDQNEVYNIRPRAVVCSAMGKTTNNLLSAGDFALGTYSEFVMYCALRDGRERSDFLNELMSINNL